MQTLSEAQLLSALMAMALIILVGRATAECARRVGQPEVLGELLGGLILGPSVLGAALQPLYKLLFSDAAVTLPISLLSWTGAILLLMLAGMEVDLGVLREYFKAGALTGVFIIVASILAGTIFGIGYLGQELLPSIFLGSVLSVTAVSVIAKILIEKNALRRNYAQVILAAGIATEVVVWPMISILSASKSGESLEAGIRITAIAVGFFLLMFTAGQKLTDFAMRRIVDVTQISYGQLSLVIVLGIFTAVTTQHLGLHALLGPFVFGLLIARAPRSTNQLKQSIHSMTLSVFAPVFFVTAGMRIDLSRICNAHSLTVLCALFLVATLTKVVFGFLGAKLGGLRSWESLLVGLGVNMRGGSDVIVAILGGSLGLISQDLYTAYAVVAILTVIISPPLISWIALRVPPSKDEASRLKKEEAKKRAYLSGIERILLPSFPELLPMECVPVIKAMAATKENEQEIFDIMELAPENDGNALLQQVSESLKEAGEAPKVGYTKSTSEASTIESILEAAAQSDLVVMGARRPSAQDAQLTLGDAQDKIIRDTQTDAFVMIGGNRLITRKIRRIIVPVNGMEYSMSASDIAAYIAHATDAEVVLFNVVKGEKSTGVKGLAYHRARRSGYKVLKESKFRTRRLNIQCQETVLIADDMDHEIVKELNRSRYDLLLLGVVNRSVDGSIFLGAGTQAILTQTNIPTGLLIIEQKANG